MGQTPTTHTRRPNGGGGRAGLLLAAVAVAFVVGMIVLNGVPWAVRSAGAEATRPGGAPALDAKAFVEQKWDSEVVPHVGEQAHELAEVAAALAADPERAGEELGVTGAAGTAKIAVKGQARVTAVDDSAKYGTAQLEVEGAPGEVTLQIGPILRGTAIRDGLPFVRIDMFANQIEYADVADELNARVRSTALADLDRKALEGSTVTLTGVMPVDGKDMLITPVTLEVGP